MAEAGIEVELDEGDAVLVSFGGVQGGFGIPPFEFRRMTADLPVGKVFIRDLRQSWYQRGVPDVGPRPGDVARYLDELVRAKRRVVFAGNSAGGFAALLFGKLVQPDEVHAFAPQTFISWPKRIVHRDFRWSKELLSLLVHTHERRYADLRRVLDDGGDHTRMHVYYSTADRLDALHAERLRGTGVQLHPAEHGGHGLVKELRDSGELEAILRRALAV